MIGWIIAAGLAGIAIGASETSKDYGPRISADHKRCLHCYRSNTRVTIVSNNGTFIKLRFSCLSCGHRWTKTYRIK